MKKSLLIIILSVFQAACATPAVAPGSAPTLLSYGDLANEITVGFRDLSTVAPAAADEDHIDTP